MRILYITTIGKTMFFFQTLIRELLDRGVTVDIASNITDSSLPECYFEWGCQVFPLTCTRHPMDKNNLLAIKEIKKIVEKKSYDIIHCHTPIVSACVRIACRKIRKQGSKVFYTAHGFHFYQNAPLKNWLFYYPIEWVCARWTDVLITINQEDFDLAKRKLAAEKIEYIPGVGVDVKRFSGTKIDIEQKRRGLGIPKDAVLLLSVGELNANKNHEFVIRALAQIGNENIHYLVVGQGDLEEYLYNLVLELHVERKVHFLGYRSDVAEIYKTADLYIHPSLREGLPVAVMEAIASKIPVVCTDIRGNRDLVDAGCLYSPTDLIGLVGKITRFVALDDISQYVEKNYENLQKYKVENVVEEMYKLYYSVK